MEVLLNIIFGIITGFLSFAFLGGPVAVLLDHYGESSNVKLNGWGLIITISSLILGWNHAVLWNKYIDFGNGWSRLSENGLVPTYLILTGVLFVLFFLLAKFGHQDSDNENGA